MITAETEQESPSDFNDTVAFYHREAQRKLKEARTVNYTEYLFETYTRGFGIPYVALVIVFVNHFVFRSMEKYQEVQSCYTGGGSDDIAPRALHAFGNKENYAIDKEFEFHRLVASLFVHKNYSDLKAISIIGFPVLVALEWIMGHGRMLFLYIAAGVSGNVFASVFAPETF